MKRVLTIQDISCVGRCSLTVALPVISCMGLETVPLPTALLSTHTAFQHVAKVDLTSFFERIEDAWEEERISFDAIYSGYLGSLTQVRLVKELWERFPAVTAGGRKEQQPRFEDQRDRRNQNGTMEMHLPGPDTEDDLAGTERPLHIVDPAMADGGRLYSGFDEDFVQAMKELCRSADVIVPNLSELCLLTDTSYQALRENPDLSSRDQQIRDMMVKVAPQGRGVVVMTGYEASGTRRGEEIGALVYDRQRGSFYAYTNRKLPAAFHGTGDIFASVLTGALTRGMQLQDAVRLAVDFVLECLDRTIADPSHVWYGVDFEAALPWLCRRCAQTR